MDYGERRVGVALSDPTGTIAQPLTTLQRRRGRRPPLAALERLAHEHDVVGVVWGLPLELDGTASEWTREVQEVGEQLGSRLDLPVYFLDERMTSVQAERAVRSSGLRRSRREDKSRVDRSAAALILQTWLDRRRGGTSTGTHQTDEPRP